MAMSKGGESSTLGGAGKKKSMSGISLPADDSTSKPVSTDPPGVMREDPLVTAARKSARKMNTEIPDILPHERVFPIQIGSELFRLSGASISSDEPSYFSQFFQSQLEEAERTGDDSRAVRTLYIDRDPVTFKDIALHLQGYHISPKNISHFVKLFADAQFYSLPRLISQLYEENIFITIGHRDFQIPRELFSDPGNSPNFFSLGYGVFFTTPEETFPGLARDGLLRPPSILPPAVPNRSAETFAEIIHLLRGYPLHIRNEDHRNELLSDCKYFHLKGLEQKLIRHSISFNLARRRDEITMRLEDVRQSGISIIGDVPIAPSPPNQNNNNLAGFVNYARPFVDAKAYELVLEIGDDCTLLHFNSLVHSVRAEFFGDRKTRISRLFEVIATKLNLPSTSLPLGDLMKQGGALSQPASPGNTPLNDGDFIRVIIGDEAHVLLDGREWVRDGDGGSSVASSAVDDDHPRKRRRFDSNGNSSAGFGEETWMVRTGQWRLRVQNARNGKGGVECVLVAVKLDATSAEAGRNAQRGFLG